nr:unnamed protein product [Digitaria exilis]
MVFHDTVSQWGIASNTLRARAASAQRAYYIRRRQLATDAVGTIPDTSIRACAAWWSDDVVERKSEGGAWCGWDRGCKRRCAGVGGHALQGTLVLLHVITPAPACPPTCPPGRARHAACAREVAWPL